MREGQPIPAGAADLDPDLRAKLTALYHEGRQISERFKADVRRRTWHPFVAADYETVERALLPLRQPGLKFLEWGSATGVITIMADLLGFAAYGIELDRDLVAIARDLAARFDSRARFAAGSFFPAGYEWRSSTGDPRLGTLGQGDPGYPQLELELDEFDLVFAYPWSGEEPIMHDLMACRAGRDARLLLHTTQGVRIHRAGIECCAPHDVAVHSNGGVTSH